MGWNQHEFTQATQKDHGKTAKGTGHNPSRSVQAPQPGRFASRGGKIGAYYALRAQENRFKEAYLNGK